MSETTPILRVRYVRKPNKLPAGGHRPAAEQIKAVLERIRTARRAS
jgi:hypothetical protein